MKPFEVSLISHLVIHIYWLSKFNLYSSTNCLSFWTQSLLHHSLLHSLATFSPTPDTSVIADPLTHTADVVTFESELNQFFHKVRLFFLFFLMWADRFCMWVFFKRKSLLAERNLAPWSPSAVDYIICYCL